MMITTRMEAALVDVERQLSDVADALVTGDPLSLQAASNSLRQAALDFAGLVQGLTRADLKDPTLQNRVKKLAEGMASHREGLVRRSAMVERQLNALVPATQNNTYTQAGRGYGSSGKQTGAFKVLTA